MSRKRLSKKQVQQRERLIRYYVKKRYSANLIQHKLREKGLGMRRKVLLEKIRQIKGLAKRPSPEKYIPRKYVARVKWRRKAEKVKPLPAGKRIAVYGTVHGESRRIEFAGSGRALYNAMLVVAKHPPKKRFVQCEAGEASNFLDFDEEWDEHPAVES